MSADVETTWASMRATCLDCEWTTTTSGSGIADPRAERHRQDTGHAVVVRAPASGPVVFRRLYRRRVETGGKT